MSHTKKAAFLSFFYFFHFGTLGIFIPFVALYLKHNGFSGKDIGLFITVISIIKFLLTNTWTKTYNKIKSKTVFVITAILVSNVSVILLLSKNYLLTFLTFIIYAVTRVGILPVMDHISNEFSRESGIEYGKIRMYGSIGFICFTTFTGLLVDYFSINVFITMTILTGFLSAITILFIKLENIERAKYKQDSNKLSFDFKIILIASILHYISLTFFHNFLNIKVEYLNESQTIAGTIWSIGIFAEILLMFFSNKLFKKISPFTLLIFSMFLGGVRSLVIGYAESAMVLLFINTIHGFAFGTFHLSIIRYIKDYIAAESRLKAQSFYSSLIYGLGAIFGSILSGYLFDFVGVNHMFMIGSIFSFFATIILLLYRKKFLLKYQL
ncbi:MFS transporter [Deferribacterales bacterium Es71-Z0220]|uniref:MFS transporter n=1 Tax=Deferrivibrio essentukiensis TaxID=2880922 RepID=UPI001F6163D0|nr:major facilitator superfamily 1 [Deferribacteraceae bacterium]MCB4204370.1 MFS transporter [Deferrivibrio essentukiensis]